MKTNGLLYIKNPTRLPQGNSGFDSDGNPIVVDEKHLVPLPCSIRTISDGKTGVYEDGKFRVASFEILVEDMGEPFRAQMVKLERYGESLGEYKVQSIEPFPTIGRIKILV